MSSPSLASVHYCCGHSHKERFEFVRHKCRTCGRVLGEDEIQTRADGACHLNGGQECGPVVEETAWSHADFVEWLFEAARRAS